jgi:hypothetical protein
VFDDTINVLLRCGSMFRSSLRWRVAEMLKHRHWTKTLRYSFLFSRSCNIALHFVPRSRYLNIPTSFIFRRYVHDNSTCVKFHFTHQCDHTTQVLIHITIWKTQNEWNRSHLESAKFKVEPTLWFDFKMKKWNVRTKALTERLSDFINESDKFQTAYVCAQHIVFHIFVSRIVKKTCQDTLFECNKIFDRNLHRHQCYPENSTIWLAHSWQQLWALCCRIWA